MPSGKTKKKAKKATTRARRTAPRAPRSRPHAKEAPTQPALDALSPQALVARIREAAERLGIELDEQEALQWLTQMAVQDKSEITVDAKNFVYGAKVAILDFSPQDLAYFRRVGAIVAIPDRPGVIETALALSGSAAQSKIQTHPGDADFFQRVNIKAPTRAKAIQILADALRAKGLAYLSGPDYHLISVKFGTHTEEGTHNGKPFKKGSPMTWSPRELAEGQFEVELSDGTRKVIRWEDGMIDPGWTKLDWVIADPERGQLSNASNLLDVTWEAEDGTITALDGVIDPYFQEVYLDAASVPVFGKLVKQVTDDAVDNYVRALEHEIYKYLVVSPNYGKVAKRAYNIFRLTGRYGEAAYIREIFDEPTTALYRVWALFETLSDAAAPDARLDRIALLKQYDALIEQVVRSTEGEKEIRIVRALMHARDQALGVQPAKALPEQSWALPRQEVMESLNAYFRDLLYGFPSIADYLEGIRGRRVSTG